MNCESWEKDYKEEDLMEVGVFNCIYKWVLHKRRDGDQILRVGLTRGDSSLCLCWVVAK